MPLTPTRPTNFSTLSWLSMSVMAISAPVWLMANAAAQTASPAALGAAPATTPAPLAAGLCGAWNAKKTYAAGIRASYGGKNYKANRSTTGENPATNSGPVGSGKPWSPTAQACTGAPAPAPAPAPACDPALKAVGAVCALQTGRIYTGYYPSWDDPRTDTAGKTLPQVYTAGRMTKVPATYTHINIAFAKPDFAWAGMAADTFAGTGIEFSSKPSDVKRMIEVLHGRNIKVVLSVGGASYNNWSGLAAEGHAGSGNTINALAQFAKDMGLDGLDVDYEINGLDAYVGAVKAMRKAADLAGKDKILAIAGWSTGADCTWATSSDPQCKGLTSYFGDKAGLERQLVRGYPSVAAGINLVNIMSYDAQTEHYDGVTAWKQYRALFPASTVVSIGLETSPEGWAGGNLVVNNADAQCYGSTITQDQYGNNRGQPYSVERYLGAVAGSTDANRNARDGAMLWHVTKTAQGNCGAAPLASPGSIGTKAATLLKLASDPALQQAPWK